MKDGNVRNWPRSAWKQSLISVVVAVIVSLSVMSYIFGEFFNAFYFPKTAHVGWTAGLTRQSSSLRFCGVGFEILVATFVLLFAVQRAFTGGEPPESN
jgi:hypothetical protein